MPKKRVLYICSLPRDIRALNFTDEISSIQEALIAATNREQYDFSPKLAMRRTQLMPTLMGTPNQDAPYIVHFSMHGDKSRGLIFSDETNQPDFVTVTFLQEIFHMLQEIEVAIDGIVFSACHSMRFAEQLRHLVKFTIGVEGTIPEIAACAFSKSFYRSLFDNWDIRRSYRAGLSGVTQWLIRDGLEIEDGGPPYQDRIKLIE